MNKSGFGKDLDISNPILVLNFWRLNEVLFETRFRTRLRKKNAYLCSKIAARMGATRDKWAIVRL